MKVWFGLMLLSTSNATQAPFAANVSPFSIYLIGLCIRLRITVLSAGGRDFRPNWLDPGVNGHTRPRAYGSDESLTRRQAGPGGGGSGGTATGPGNRGARRGGPRSRPAPR